MLCKIVPNVKLFEHGRKNKGFMKGAGGAMPRPLYMDKNSILCRVNEHGCKRTIFHLIN